MIVRPRPRMRELFFIWKGSIIPLILPQVLFVTAVATLVTLLADLIGPRFPDFATGPFTFLGLSLSLFLGFRNNACYDRWWEARKHYGNLLVVLRCLARDSQLLETDAEGKQQRKDVLRLCTAFTKALTARLRDRPIVEAVQAELAPAEITAIKAGHNIPDSILRLVTALLLQARQAGRLDSVTYCAMAEHSLGHATPLLTALVAYTFFGLDALGDELEEPFGTSQNDLPLDAITRVIEIDLAEYRGLENRPEPLKPQNFVLM